MERKKSSGVTNLAFNQDQGCFTSCLENGLRIYNVDPLAEKSYYNIDEIGRVALCEMIYRSNWLMIVTESQPSSLHVVDDRQKKKIARVEFKSLVRGLRARVDKVAVVLCSSIQVLALPSLERITLLRIPSYTRPLCAITLNTATESPQLVAAPAHRIGSVQLMDISRAVIGGISSSPAVVNCHQSQLASISLSSDGFKLATASERGNVIRLWDTVAKVMLHELRRGSDYADVYCINFNVSGSLVCCVSDKGTLHVWHAQNTYGHVCAKAFAEASNDDARGAICGFSGNNDVVGE
ncbi:unnamed protein product [Euphydryas editha]|uniref:Uncharacterized protein n=1 Tax=Euphydryas editha TaxID=104508 RepID=A0AAU9TQW1_EUPED|nr:unnamed protein product [Euphydryas editha]